MMRRGWNRGAGEALLAAALFGVTTPFAKLALAQAEPALVAGLLYLGSGLGLAGWRLASARRGRPAAETPLRRADVPWLLGAIGFGGVVAPILLLVGLRETPASVASLLLNLEAVATAALAWVAFRENVDRRVAMGFTCILAGGVVLTWPGGGLAWSPGALAIVAACVAWGLDNNLTRRISDRDPAQIAMVKGLVAGAVNTSVALALGSTWPAGGVVGSVLALGFLGYGFSLVLFVRALRGLGTARAGAYFSTAPFVGVAVALALGEGHADGSLLVAGGLMAVGVWLHLTERHEHEHRHEALTHEHRHRHDAHHQHAHGPDDPPGEPHSHLHRHEPITHSHPHYPDAHHRHRHGPGPGANPRPREE